MEVNKLSLSVFTLFGVIFIFVGISLNSSGDQLGALIFIVGCLICVSVLIKLGQLSISRKGQEIHKGFKKHGLTDIKIADSLLDQWFLFLDTPKDQFNSQYYKFHI